MRWTIVFLAAALAVVYFGMTRISDNQANGGEPVATESAPAVLSPVGTPEPMASPTTVGRPMTTEYVSGCIDTSTTCRCIDKQGTPLDLTRRDCKGVLGVGPK